ncbi:conserved hypothetical protein [methanotrophic bacterial endosymbiont of Bathymodiolus sp.]|nr:hypothetical protein BZ164_18995 [Pseudomonas veronii]SMG64322.1 conserved hypothetical protein [methanotrophic bacterial endosymbiont of Bathymodiolus sp.]
MTPILLNHYHVHTAFFQCYQRLKHIVQTMGLRVDLYPQISQAGREDTAGWKMDQYQTYLVWKDLEDGSVLKLSHADAEDKYLSLHLKMNESPVSVSWTKKLFTRKRS